MFSAGAPVRDKRNTHSRGVALQAGRPGVTQALQIPEQNPQPTATQSVIVTKSLKLFTRQIIFKIITIV
jgi:hypothetical protein